MKIVQVRSAFYPAIGGVANYVHSLSSEMVKRGNEVSVVTSTLYTNKEPGIEETGGIRVKRVKHLFKIGGTPVIPNLYSELRRIDADIIHAHLPTPYTADIACYVARKRNIPCVLTYHNDIVGRGINKYIAAAYNHLVLKKTLSDASAIISTQQRYLKMSPYLKRFSQKIAVIPCGVDTERFKPLPLKKDENSIFFLSMLNRYHRYKGLDCLLEALPQVKMKVKNLKLVVGGEGEWLGYYRQRVEALGLKEEVEFHGFIPDDSLAEYYNRCSVFVLPSISSSQEGFGMVLLEALACGTPVITTDIVGVAVDIKDSHTGTIVQPEDTGAMADAIIRLLVDKKSAVEMGRRGRKLVEDKYGWGRVGAEVLKLYGELR